jgi:gamma-glutamylaminecyclotransferase
MTNRVFVYGTLKRWYPNNPLLEGSEFLGEAVTAPTYKMVTCKMVETSFPVIMPDPSGKQVAGEIYAVDDATLARLDQLERAGRSYDRVMIDATLPLSNGDRLPTHAFIYVGREDRFGEMFARGPLYEQANERGELDWRAC